MREQQNLTLKIDTQVLLWARMRALRDGTSINRRIRHYLEEYAAIPPDQRSARADAAPAADETNEPGDLGNEAPAWPEFDPGEAGSPGSPPDHDELWGSDGRRVATSGEGRIRSELRQLRRQHRARG